MNGIHITALLTSVLAAIGMGTLIHRLRQPADGRLLLLAVLAMLPLQPLVFHLVRMPLDQWLVGHLGRASVSYQWLTSLYAPLTEEPAKLVVLLIGAMALIAYFILGRASPGRLIFGRRHCPGCSADYDAPLIAVNFGTTRYERCPHCRRWHWTKACDA